MTADLAAFLRQLSPAGPVSPVAPVAPAGPCDSETGAGSYVLDDLTVTAVQLQTS